MDNLLKKISIAVGAVLLVISMFWSQDGFNFDLAGDSGGGDLALVIGWALAVSVTCIQFVFSTNFNKLNASLITFGVLAYVYSIYTNAQGIIHFQGESANKVGAWILGFVMDGVPEPLIAWGLGDSLSGDFVGNVLKALFSGSQNSGGRGNKNFTQSKPNLSPRPVARHATPQSQSFKRYPPQSPAKTKPEFGKDIKSFLREMEERGEHEQQ